MSSEQGPLAGDVSQQDPLDRAFEAYERRYRHLGEIEFDNSAWRMELRHRLDNLQQHLNRFQTSFESYMDPPSNPAGSNTSTKKPRARRKKMRTDAKLDFEALKDQMYALNTLTEQLRDNDRKQDAAEGSFNNAVEAIVTTLRRRGLISTKEKTAEVFLAPTIASTSEHSSDVVIPIAAELEAYYDAVSTLRNMAERIGELQVEQQEQLERRGVMEDQGQVLEQNEEDFLNMWRNLFDVACDNFKAAQTAVREKRQECNAMNVEIPAWAEVDSVGEKAESLNNDAPDHDMISLANSIPTNKPLLQDLRSPLPTPPQKSMAKDSIFRWIENTGPNLDSQPQDFPQDIPLPLSRGSTPVMEQQDNAPVASSLTTHDRKDTVAGSSRSDDATATTLPHNMAFGAMTAVPRPPSLGNERGLEADDGVWKVAPLETASSQ
jgi:hypothetical protein